MSNIDKLENLTSEGKVQYLDNQGYAQCARLPLAWQIDQESWLESRMNRSARLSENWVKGNWLQNGMSLTRGSVIATFKSDGKYAQTNSGVGGENHTAIFLNWAVENGVRGMRVIQQMSHENGRAIEGFIPFDNNNEYYRNANRFSVVKYNRDGPKKCTP